ncbi:MAG: nucleotidyltransferase domain-containing protein [Labilithrix sp.]|nr:nucleotidyltransferase domain-containing protein [Labilithrix sp.]MCW5816402.1 nucleotidyltransferase domain-containing protein [Labilithrix sp.]
MSNTHPMYQGLPASVRARLEEWQKSLEATFGADLVAVLLTGGVARGDYKFGESDVNAIVIVRGAISFERLEAIASATQAARYGARLSPSFIHESELAGACDAFPLLYDEVKRWHIRVFGEDALAKVVVHDTHRRLRIEQELREAVFWLRRAVTDSLGAREAVGGSVLRKIRQVRRPLAALLALRGVEHKADVASVVAAAGAHYGVDVSSLAAPRERPEEAHAALTKLLGHAIEDVDRVSTGPESLRREP